MTLEEKKSLLHVLDTHRVEVWTNKHWYGTQESGLTRETEARLKAMREQINKQERPEPGS